MSDKPTASFILNCWGCNRFVTCPYESYEDSKRQMKELEKDGWQRREFGPNSSPWFCSEDCAFHSLNALAAEEWWRGHKSVSTTPRPQQSNGVFLGVFVGVCLLTGMLVYWRNAIFGGP